MAPEFASRASFSSREPDWSIPLEPQPPPWTERWGRKALGWTLGLLALAALGGTAAWMVQETRVESTLAVVAGHTPAQTPTRAELPAPAPRLEREAEPLPPLKLLPPEPVGTATLEKAENRDVVAAAPPARKPVVEPAPERRGGAAPEQRKRPGAKKPAPKSAPKPTRERVLARAPAEPARRAPAAASGQTPDPQSPLADTLRLCRAAGYHATACLKRGCEATRFGLVCRG